jgi:prevent-host-death family protein
MVWQLQAAKQKFSELVERALREGPQVVTRRGREVVVVVGIDHYQRLRSGEPDFKRFLSEAPDFTLLDYDRSREPVRLAEL